MKRKWYIWALMAVFLSMILWSSAKLIGIAKENAAGADTYDGIRKLAVMDKRTEEEPEKELPEEEKELIITLDGENTVQTQAEDKKAPVVDFDALRAINPHVQGWLFSVDGKISYPVVRGEDNEYYLDHLVDGTQNKNGTLFMDFRNAEDLTDRNTFIYGHNMRSGAMLGRLEDMGAAEFELITPQGTYLLSGFAGYVTPGNSDIYQITYADEEEFESYLHRIRLISEFDSSVEVTKDDRIVTLSTCAYDYDDARYVLHCKLVRKE